LRALADKVDIEDYEMMDTISKDPEQDDNTEGWIDEIVLLSAQEKAELENDIRPIRFVLAKVSKDLPSALQGHEVEFPIGAQVVLQDYTLDDPPPPCMGHCMQGGRLDHAADPTRCLHSLELEL
jgi:hypothetical protein